MDKHSENTSSNNNEFNFRCDDILGGFQELSPELFVIIGEILANVIAGKIPFNVQNAIGNWLQLVGQIIETYNAQQQYFQGGPGRYYNPMYYNVSNPFCQNKSRTTEGNSSSGSYYESGMNTNAKEYSNQDDIQKLRRQLEDMQKHMKELEAKIINYELSQKD